MFWTRARSISPKATMGSGFELFNRIFGPADQSGAVAAFPAFNVWADTDGASVTSELPGVSLKDLEITASGNSISIKGTRKGEEGEEGRKLRRERPVGEFNRSIELPFKIDAARVEAKLVNGVLEISLPRAENDKPRKIAITAN